MAPLYQLLHKTAVWKSGATQEKAFGAAKELLQSPQLLVHYDCVKDLVLTCDASPYWVGAILAHCQADGTEQPIGYASRTLAPAERQYAQVDKEALAILVGVKKFHPYIYGRRFTIIFGPQTPYVPLRFDKSHSTNGFSAGATLGPDAKRLRVEYRPGKDQTNADGLSRLPLPSGPTEVPHPGDILLLLERLESSPVSAAEIRAWTSKDPVLSKVRRYALHGWPVAPGELLTLYTRMTTIVVIYQK